MFLTSVLAFCILKSLRAAENAPAESAPAESHIIITTTIIIITTTTKGNLRQRR